MNKRLTHALKQWPVAAGIVAAALVAVVGGAYALTSAGADSPGASCASPSYDGTNFSISCVVPQSTVTVAGPTTTQTVTVTPTTSAPTTTAPASPTPTPTPTTPTGFPDASNTGATGTLTPYTGPADLTAASNGLTFSNCAVTKALTIEANVTVTFNNCSFTVRTSNIVTGKPNAHATFNDCTVNGGYSQGTQAAFIGSGLTVNRCNIFAVGEGAQMDGQFTVTNSYIHDLYGSGGSHNNAVFSNGSQTGPIVITGNTLSAIYTSNDTTSTTGVSGAVSLYGDFAQVNNVKVIGNLIYSQNTGIYGGSISGKKFPHAANVTIQNNEFDSGHGDSGLVDFEPSQYGNSADVGNVWINGPKAGKSAG